MAGAQRLVLRDGDQVAIIGGGPAGAFFSISASKLARDLGKRLNITIYERKTFVNQGPAGCNMCAAVVSESMVQSLALEGINLPSTVVQRGIESYFFHTQCGSVEIKSSRLQQRGIAATYRGGGPKGSVGKGIQSFDEFLLQKAVEHGAKVEHIVVDDIRLGGDKPRLYSGGKLLQECDLLVGAFGVNARTAQKFEDLGTGYKSPPTIRATQAEIELTTDWVTSHFGHSIHLFLLNLPGIKFIGITPKGDYITISIIGKEPKAEDVKAFLAHPVMRKRLPPDFQILEKFCHCFPKINVGVAQHPFANRMVIIGDASSARLYKDGIGSAYMTSKAAAQAALLYGVGEEDFRENYLPLCKTLNRDNLFGQFLFYVNDLITSIPPLSRGYFKMIQWEQEDSQKDTPHSDILWDMFTGSRFYKDVFLRTLRPWPLLRWLGATATSYLPTGAISTIKQ
jgi:flavin-dependent dehydrogenase